MHASDKWMCFLLKCCPYKRLWCIWILLHSTQISWRVKLSTLPWTLWMGTLSNRVNIYLHPHHLKSLILWRMPMITSQYCWGNLVRQFHACLARQGNIHWTYCNKKGSHFTITKLLCHGSYWRCNQASVCHVVTSHSMTLTLGFLSLEQSEIWSLQEFSCTHTWQSAEDYLI